MPNTFEVTYAAYAATLATGDTLGARRALNELVAMYEPFVGRLARRIAQGDDDDLRQVGLLAVARAVEKYEPTRGAFNAFARRKIHDAFDLVVDLRPQVRPTAKWGRSATCHGLCKMPKTVRRAEQAFIARTGEIPTALDLGVDAEDLDAWRAKTTFAPYEENLDDGPDQSAEGIIVAAITDATHALSKKLRRTIGDMTLQEQRILLARVFEGLDFAVIGEEEGLLRDTTTRMYKRAIEKLRSALAA